MKFDNVDWVQVTRYIAVHMIAEEIINAHNELTVGQVRDRDWLPRPPPSEAQKIKLLGLIMGIGTGIIMSNHIFMVGDEVFRQNDGGPIGLEFAGANGRAVMMMWDHLNLERVNQLGYIMPLYER